MFPFSLDATEPLSRHNQLVVGRRRRIYLVHHLHQTVVLVTQLAIIKEGALHRIGRSETESCDACLLIAITLAEDMRQSCIGSLHQFYGTVGGRVQLNGEYPPLLRLVGVK